MFDLLRAIILIRLPFFLCFVCEESSNTYPRRSKRLPTDQHYPSEQKMISYQIQRSFGPKLPRRASESSPGDLENHIIEFFIVFSVSRGPHVNIFDSKRILNRSGTN